MPKKKIIACRDRLDEMHDVPADELVFRPGAYAIIIEDGKVLMSKQWDGYDFPGGGVGIDETFVEACVRECREETGLEVEVGQVVDASTEFFWSLKRQEGWNCQQVYYLARRVGGELSIDNVDEDEKGYMGMPEWIPIEDLPKLKIYNGVEDVPGLVARAVQLSEVGRADAQA